MNNYYSGYYQVGGEKFISKMFAAIKATETNQPLTWHFHDELFSSIRPTGAVNLKELYKQRAQQLRDKYDYLMLYFSGGSDSWTVLNTFLENNIKLDHVVVRWSMAAVDKGVYKANNQDRSASNMLSEWDFTIKKDLDYLAKNHPDIKIEIVDWLDDLSTDTFNDTILENALSYASMSSLLRINKGGSPTERKLVEEGKTVGAIYGVDKPFIIKHGNQVFFHFQDGAISICPPRPENPNGTEYFFWTPDMPHLAVEQAYQVYLHYKRNIELSDIIDSRRFGQWDREMMRNYETTADVIRSIVYPDWDRNKFQVYKSNAIPGFEGRERDYWLEIHPEMQTIKPAWRHYWVSYFDKIDPKFLLANKDFKNSISKFHYLGNV
jgi:hypothetical protein